LVDNGPVAVVCTPIGRARRRGARSPRGPARRSRGLGLDSTESLRECPRRQSRAVGSQYYWILTTTRAVSRLRSRCGGIPGDGRADPDLKREDAIQQMLAVRGSRRPRPGHRGRSDRKLDIATEPSTRGSDGRLSDLERLGWRQRWFGKSSGPGSPPLTQRPHARPGVAIRTGHGSRMQIAVPSDS